MIKLCENIYSNISIDHVATGSEMVHCILYVPIIYKKKPDQRIRLSLYFAPSGVSVKETILDLIPKYLSEKQRECYNENGAIITSLWQNKRE
jgi:hypothetical protein